jgi:hypothetical protein
MKTLGSVSLVLDVRLVMEGSTTVHLVSLVSSSMKASVTQLVQLGLSLTRHSGLVWGVSLIAQRVKTQLSAMTVSVIFSCMLVCVMEPVQI